MIVCSCAVISDEDIERAVIEIMTAPAPLLPTPGVVFRHLSKKMNCCTCAPVAVAAIYAAMDELEACTRVNAFALSEARNRLVRIEERRAARQAKIDAMHATRKTVYPRTRGAA